MFILQAMKLFLTNDIFVVPIICAHVIWISHFTDAAATGDVLQFDGASFTSFNVSSTDTKRFHIEFRLLSHSGYGTVLQTDRESFQMKLKENRLRWYQSTDNVLQEMASLPLDIEREWHDVEITYDGSNVRFQVDSNTNIIQTSHSLELGTQIFIGGIANTAVDQNNPQQNFIGCLQSVLLNGVALFDNTHDQKPPVNFHGNVQIGCKIPIKHVTYHGDNSYLRIPSETKGENSVYRAAFDLRTYDINATLLYVDMGNGVNITPRRIHVPLGTGVRLVYHDVLGMGLAIKDLERILQRLRAVDLEDNMHLLAIYMDGETVVQILYELYTGLIIRPGDGEWHRFSFELNNSTGLTMTLDKWAIVDEKIKSVVSSDSRTFYLGGIPDSMGFTGCMKDVLIDGKEMDLSRLNPQDIKMATVGRCDLPNRCAEASCSNGGLCHQTRSSFACNCSGTGYAGAICHTPLYSQSCDLVKMPNGSRFKTAVIDVDGSGPINPQPVICHRESPNRRAQTIIQTIPSNDTTVDGFQAPGSFVRNISYESRQDEISALLDRAATCRQYIEYNCTNSRLLSTEENSKNGSSFGWWVGRNNQSHVYWGGAKPGSNSCACASSTSGCLGQRSCNCDASSSVPSSDSGYLSEKSHLPVTQVRFGDTGTTADDKVGRYRVDPIVCQGDIILDNTVTFNQLGASTKLPLTFTETPLDISFQFRTGIRRAYLLHTKVNADSKDGTVINALAIRLSGSFSLVVDFTLNKRRTVFKNDVSFRLNDNNWHTVYFEFNVIEATLSVDGETGRVWKADTWTSKYGFPTQAPITIGNSLSGGNGFLGCMRELRINGRAVDLVGASKLPRLSHGVQPGCQGKCDHVSNPCMNGGRCQDYFATYMCDCSATAFTGCYCGLDLGAHIKSDGGIMYRLDKRLNEKERVFRILKFGFKTTRNLGVLTHITNAHPGFPDFISVELDTDGSVVVFVDVGHGEATIHSSAGKVTDGKVHQVVLTYNTTEEEIVLKVDGISDVFNLTRSPSGIDTILDTPKRLYIARVARTVPGAGFEGCLFRLTYNNHPVLQDVFLNPTPNHVFLVGRGKIRRSSCGQSESFPRDIRQLHGPRKLPPGSADLRAPQPPLVSNVTASVSEDQVVTLQRSHVMDGFQEIVCSASGVPSPIYTWMKNNGPLSCPHLAVPGGTLLMPEDDRLDGSYQCVAHNKNGRALSDKVAFESPRITRLRSVRRHKLVIREGGFLRLECSEHVDSVPDTTVSWLYSSQLRNRSRIFRSPTGALNILPVLKSDTSLNFTCVKTNELLDVSIKVKVITLTVISVTVKELTKASETRLVYQTPPPLTSFVGKTVRLECLLKGEAAKELKWHRENTTEDTSWRWKLENKGRQLLVPNVTEADEGWYLCSTSVATFARFFVDITSRPIWTKGLWSTTAYQGGEANFTCLSRSAAGEPTPRRPRWFKNGRRLLGNRRHVFSENNTRLTIKNVTADKDFQTIQCNVSNHRGYSFSEAVLDIVEPLRIIEQPSEVSVMKGGTVSIHVSVTLDKKLGASFTWLKTDQHLGKLNTKNSDPRKVFKVTSTRNTSTLTLNTEYVAEEDIRSYTGYYVCVVADGVGEQIARGKIVITLPLTPPPEDDSSVLLGLAIAITLGVIFIGVVIGIICITRRRKKGRQDEVSEMPLKSPVGSTS